MKPVLRIDEKLASLTKPPLERINSFHFSPEDCLILSAGFEDRALGVIRNAASHSNNFKVILVEYLPALAENKVEDIIQICNQARVKVERLVYDRQHPAGFGELLVEKTIQVKGRVLIDISAMSRLLIVQTLVALNKRPNGFRNTFLTFAEAHTYPPSKEEFEEAIHQIDVDPFYAVLFLSSGVFSVTVVPELSALSLGSNQSRLVVFPSFNPDQLTALRAELQPSRFAFVHGVPPSAQNAWRKEAMAKLNRLDSLDSEERQDTSTLDYRETLDYLLRLYEKYGIRERLLISPTGSKMQTVAVGIFKAFIEDVQIVYPTPREYRSPKNYTTGVGQMYQLALEAFSSIGSPH